MSHVIFRSDKMHGTYNVGSLVNVKLTKPLDNGCVVKAVKLAEGERDAYEGEDTATTTLLSEVAIIAEPEVMYDESKDSLADFTNDSGSIVRAYRLHAGDEFSLSKAGLTGTTTVGHVVELAAGNKLKGSAHAGEATQVGTIIANEGDLVVIRVG